jgi:Effector-associated domain 11
MNKSEFLNTLRDLVSEGRTKDALDFLHNHIKDFAAYFINDIVMLKSRFFLAKHQFTINGIINNSEFERISAIVNIAILELADKIETKSETSDVQRQGHLLHKIPSAMVKNRETKCIIRIAYFLEHLLIGLTIDDDITVQSIQITKLMSVQLLDYNETRIFEIRTSTDEEQFTIHDECTQWIFYVRPVRVGKFPLLLKIGIVEVVNGKERKRNIVIEKLINVTVKNSVKEDDKFKLISWERWPIKFTVNNAERSFEDWIGYEEYKRLENKSKSRSKINITGDVKNRVYKTSKINRFRDMLNYRSIFFWIGLIFFLIVVFVLVLYFSKSI